MAEIIVQKHGITELAVDSRRHRLYWVTTNEIESSDYDKKNKRVILQNTNAMRSLTVLGDQLFWYEAPNLMNPNLTIWTCNSNNCGDSRILNKIKFLNENFFKKFAPKPLCRKDKFWRFE